MVENTDRRPHNDIGIFRMAGHSPGADQTGIRKLLAHITGAEFTHCPCHNNPYFSARAVYVEIPEKVREIPYWLWYFHHTVCTFCWIWNLNVIAPPVYRPLCLSPSWYICHNGGCLSLPGWQHFHKEEEDTVRLPFLTLSHTIYRHGGI